MFLVTTVIFLTTILPIMAVVVHLGNTGRVFINRKEVFGITVAVGLLSVGVGLLSYQGGGSVTADIAASKASIETSEHSVANNSHVANILAKYGSGTMAPSANSRYDALFGHGEVTARPVNWGMINRKYSAIRKLATGSETIYKSSGKVTSVKHWEKD